MREVTVLNGQTIFDIAVSECGSIESAYEIALMNGIDVFSDIETGTVLKVPDVGDKQLAKTFLNEKPASERAYVQENTSETVKTDVTYSELLSLRNQGKLQSGRFYRITDYATTTAQQNTDVAGHHFNIIVQALSNHELSETAQASVIADDDYFSNSKLSAWKIMYCIDNDSSRFAWVDSVNGKGVIYYMCDENNNSAPYDFKNIKFRNLYTFNCLGEDFSLNGVYCRNNEIRPCSVNGVQILNGNILDNLYEGDCSNNFFDYNCHNNYLVDNCYNNRFGVGCSGNTLYYSCYNNIFGMGCNNNELSDMCCNNHFMSNSSNNRLGIFCQDNHFNADCSNNVFKSRSSRNCLDPYCRYITLGTGSTNNRFGSRCTNNTLGDEAIGNTFGVGCQNNTFGNSCKYNSFGNYCLNVSFRSGASLEASVIAYVQSCHVSDGCSYMVVYGRTGSSSILQNINIRRGIAGTSTEYKYITIKELNAGYEVTVARKPSGEIVTYCEADLV